MTCTIVRMALPLPRVQVQVDTHHLRVHHQHRQARCLFLHHLTEVSHLAGGGPHHQGDTGRVPVATQLPNIKCLDYKGESDNTPD